MPMLKTRSALKRWGVSRKATYVLYGEILVLAASLGILTGHSLVSLVCIVAMVVILRFRDLSMAVLGLLSIGWGVFAWGLSHAMKFDMMPSPALAAVVFTTTLIVHLMAIDHLHCTGESAGASPEGADNSC